MGFSFHWNAFDIEEMLGVMLGVKRSFQVLVGLP
jgi:hypothetical protein